MSGPRVLTIAGSDPAGGAGVQADLATFAAFGVRGGAVITALTAQTAARVRAIHPVAAAIVTEQIGAALDASWDEVAAVKTGMLATAANVHAVAQALLNGAAAKEGGSLTLVVDPVLQSSSGATLLDDEGLEAMRDVLMPIATLVTPNLSEAGAILGRSAPATVEAMGDAARAISLLGPQWVLVKGGHLGGPRAVDVITNGEVVRELAVPRVLNADPHGTGCRLSAAITALVARGDGMLNACAEAQRWLAHWIATGEMVSPQEAIR